ncbi:MAG: YccF domain-containing protein [Anaerolineae bacterium]|nr:YccF domain-containing protein [Anaerolineae bacterium]
MSFLGNVVWLVFGGLVVGIEYVVSGLALCLTIVGIPFGVRSIKLGLAALTPFGKEVVDAEHQGPVKLLFDIVWILLFGWEIAVTHLVSALVLALTVVGIPFAVQHLKLVPIALLPFNKDLRAPK